MKKLILTISLLAVAISVVSYASQQYKAKLVDAQIKAQEELKKIEIVQDEEREKQRLEEENRINNLVHGLLNPMKQLMLEAINTGEPLKVVAFGSEAVASKDEVVAWPTLLEEQVNELYEYDVVTVETISIGTRHAFSVVGEKKHVEVAEMMPDVLIIEPFIWNDQGVVSIDDTVYHLGLIIDTVKEYRDDVLIYIQPPHPLYGASYILPRIDEVKNFAKQNQFVYVDHWSLWPSIDDEEVLTYLGGSLPNQDGHQLWAQSIIPYFVNH
ncbi:MAG: hypothetical protein LRY71_01890 [Bacillaceae bacterium]|nr:hypothetical protein [Bacillaceae bacterium]